MTTDDHSTSNSTSSTDPTHPTHPTGPASPTTPVAPAPRRRTARRTWAIVLAVGLTATGTLVAATAPGSASSTASGTAAARLPQQHALPADGQGSPGPAGTTTTAAAATAAQQVGVVTITSTLGYADGEAAGTGVVLTSDGEVLTNNHVVEGATSLSVTVGSTGATYTARVVGTDATDDVAVLRLVGASHLATVRTDADGASSGEAVTAVGNAGGTGDLVAAAGTITATGQGITTQSEGSAAGESLTGLLQVDADIVAGDSGGPLLDAQGEVVGIDTAASSGSPTVTGFAIPIATALAVVAQIDRGTASDGVTLGLPAFLGVQLATLTSPDGSGALLAGVVDGTPAAQAGLVAGDVVTALDGAAVPTADALGTALATHRPGDRVGVTWTDASGASRTAAVVLAQGPAA